MNLYLSDWRLDMMLACSALGVAVSAWLSLAAKHAREDAPQGMLTTLERLSFTMTSRGDVFRLVSQLGWLFFLLAVVLFRRPGVNVLMAAWIVGQLSVPVHSFLLLTGTKRGVESIKGIPAAHPPEFIEQPDGEDEA